MCGQRDVQFYDGGGNECYNTARTVLRCADNNIAGCVKTARTLGVDFTDESDFSPLFSLLHLDLALSRDQLGHDQIYLFIYCRECIHAVFRYRSIINPSLAYSQ